MEQTTQSVHGHEVIHLIHEAAGTMTRAAVEAEVTRRYGTGVSFHTCSAQGLSLEQLLGFLISRGKVVELDGRLHVQLSEVCGGEGHQH